VIRRTALAITLAVTAVVAAANVVVSIGAAVLAPGQGPLDLMVLALAILAMATVGIVLAIRVPANSVGLLLVVSSLALGVETLGLTYAHASLAFAGGSWPGTALAAWLDMVMLPVPVLIMTVGIPLIFPDGRLLSARWRWAVAAICFFGAISLLQGGFVPRVTSYTNLENPFYIEGLGTLLSVVHLPDIAEVVVFLLPIASIVTRYRRGKGVERQQLKWLIAATAFAAIAWIVVVVGGVIGSSVVTAAGWYSALLSFTGFPIAIGIAVLRYRLYEIDRIIGRTIAWAVVTGVLVSVFAGIVVALEAALIDFTQGETLAVAVSTLVAAALFQPLRRRVQLAVDRRFDRATYDAKRTVEAFAERLRDEVALDAVIADLQQTVAGSIKPTSLELWLRPGRPRAEGGSSATARPPLPPPRPTIGAASPSQP
jgi:hypothetical protein